MGNYIMLIIGMVMLSAYSIYKIAKVRKYSEKVEAEIMQMECYRYESSDITYYTDNKEIMKMPTYRYSYKGLTYSYNNGWATNSNIKVGKKQVIRINPEKPNKAYVPVRGANIVYLIFTLGFLIFGTISCIVI